MRRELRLRLVPAGAWTLATGAAVALSWFGVHTVLAGTDYEPPRTLPVTDATSHSAEPRSSSTHRPKPPEKSSPSPSPSRGKPSPGKSTKTPSPGRSGTGEPEKSQPPAPPPDPGPGSGDGGHEGKVKGTTVKGGRAVFDMGSKSATLVSATPDAGWDMRVWDSSTWIRVTFTKGDSSATVFCRWNDSEPRIETFSE